MISSEHYFDWAATSPQDKELINKAMEFSLEHWGNPSSIHAAGTDARSALEKCRQDCAKTLGVKADRIFFTSGGTESDHLALLSVLSRPQKGSVVISAVEHPALREMAKMITNCGWKIITVNPDKNGFVTPEAIMESLQDDTAFVTVMAVNNETGNVQPIYKIADALNEWGKNKRKPFFHVDCVQAAGKIPLDISYPGIDSAAFSAHKICGPRGIGILYLAKNFNSFLKGGGQENNIRSGTENVFGAAAFSYVLDKHFIPADDTKNPDAHKRFAEQKEYTRDFLTKIAGLKGAALIPHNRLELPEDDFSPWVVQSAFPGIPGQVMERALSTKGFYISTGSACSSGHHSRPILDTMQIPPKEKESAVRFSFGPETTKQAMDELFLAVKEVVEMFAN